MQVLAVSVLILRFPEKCGRVSAVNESALGLGFAISPFLGGILYDKCKLNKTSHPHFERYI